MGIARWAADHHGHDLETHRSLLGTAKAHMGQQGSRSVSWRLGRKQRWKQRRMAGSGVYQSPACLITSFFFFIVAKANFACFICIDVATSASSSTQEQRSRGAAAMAAVSGGGGGDSDRRWRRRAAGSGAGGGQRQWAAV